MSPIRDDIERARRFSRRLLPYDPQAPVPPPLPSGALVVVPNRGEMFVRLSEGPKDAIPVLLLHGWTVSADLNWFRVYQALGQHHPVVAVDHRGHGRGIRDERKFTLEDCADDAAALLDVLGMEQVIAVGYSMGGPISLLMAQRHPAKVGGLVCQATALEWRGSRWERLVWRVMSVFEFTSRAVSNRSLLRRAMRQAIDDSPDLEPFRAWLLGEFRRGNPSDIADAGRALADYDARPFASTIGKPAAVVITTRDRAVRRKKQEALATALGAQRFEIAADHDVCLVRPHEFAKVTLDAVGSVAARIRPG